MQIRPDLIAPPLHPRPSATEAKTNPSPGARAAACAPCAWWAGERGGGAGRLILTIKRLNSPRLGPAGEPPGLLFCCFFFAELPPQPGSELLPAGTLLACPAAPPSGSGPPPSPALKPPALLECGAGSSGSPFTTQGGTVPHRSAPGEGFSPPRAAPPSPAGRPRSTHLLGHGVDEANVEILFRPDP